MPPELATNQKVGSSNLSGRTIIQVTSDGPPSSTSSTLAETVAGLYSVPENRPLRHTRVNGYINDEHMAINCKTGQEYTYSAKHERWGPELSKWTPEYHTSVRRTVCGDAKTK
jgi:hypothetical protein